MQMIVRLHRMSHKAQLARMKPFARMLEILIRMIFGAVIPAGARIAPSAFFEHSGLGVVLNAECVIEAHCRIGVHVVLGGRAPLRGAPIIREGAIIHSGAVIVGRVTVGIGSVVAANAVVTRDVPDRNLFAGVPATSKRANINVAEYR
jgi:serine O-acetyltransferase